MILSYLFFSGNPMFKNDEPNGYPLDYSTLLQYHHNYYQFQAENEQYPSNYPKVLVTNNIELALYQEN